MKKTILMMVAMASLTASAQKRWTLNDCVSYAIDNNLTLKQARLQRQSATEERKQSQSALLPSLSLATNQSVGYRPWTEMGTTTVTNGTVNTKVNKTYYNGSYGLNASWTVWNGNQNRNQVKLNEVAEEQADLSIEETANSIQERIAQLYVQVLYLGEAINVAQQSLKTSQENEARGQQMVEVGKMSRADLAQLTAQRATDEYNVVEAQSQWTTYKTQLKQLLELTGDTPFDVAEPSATDQQALADIPALATVYEQALALRPEIRSSELQVKSSDLQMKIARAGHLPTINMTGGIGTSSNSLSNNTWGKQMKTNVDASVGASVSIPLFDQRRTKTAVNKAQIQREQAQVEIANQQDQLYATVESYWVNAQSNQQKFRAATASVASEQESYDKLSEQFRLGLVNTIELMTGKDRLLSAQQNCLQAKYLAILNQQLLRFYQGQPMNI